jgi:hypothetical protein
VRTRLASAALVALSTLGCAWSSPARTPNASAWLDIKTPHFRIRTSLPRDQAIETANYMETTRAAMLQAAWGGSAGPPGSTDVVVFARSTAFDSVVDPFVAGETLMRSGFERMLVFSRNTGVGVPSLAAHEMAHDLSSWYMPFQPSWLAEGLASYLETIRFGKKSKNAFVGAPPSGRMRALEMAPRFDTRSLLAADSDEEVPSQSFYGQSWLLVRYLIEEHSEAFAAFQRRLMDVADWRDAFEFSMPEGVSAGPNLDHRLQAYWADRANWVFAVTKPVEIPVITPEIRALSSAAVHGLYSWILRGNRARTEEEADAALRLDPGETMALRTKMYLLPSTPEQRAEYARSAVAGHPESVDAWLLAMSGSRSETEALAALRQAERLEPWHPQVQAARGYLRVKAGEAKAALPHLRFALHRMRPDAKLLKAYVTALAANDRCLEARQLVEGEFPAFSTEARNSFKATYLVSCGPAVVHSRSATTSEKAR